MADGEKPNLTGAEKIFVGALAVFTFIVALGFVIATLGWGIGFPGPFAAVALGISIACIVYAFLGGVAGAEFTVVAGLKLAGSLAAIAIVYYLISTPLQNSMNDAKAIADGRRAEAAIQKERQKASDEHSARVNAENELRDFKSQFNIRQSDSDSAVVERVRGSTAKDDIGRGILALYRNRQGPFRSQPVKFQSRFIQDVEAGTFRYCHGKRPELDGKKVEFELVTDPTAGTSRKIQLLAGADIGPGACDLINFDVQLGCDAAKALLQLDCDERRGVGWTSSSDNRVYELPATLINPDFD